MRDLSDLGREVRTEQDRELARLGAVNEARQRFLAGSFGPKRRAARAVFALAAAALLVFAGFFVLHTRSRSLAFAVGEEPFVTTAGRRVVSPADRTTPVRFSDGSILDLSAGGSLVIAAIGHSGAVAELERGRTSVHVVHDADTHWALRAGPYTLDIVGTRFDVEWKPDTARLLVLLVEGRVVVSGGSLLSPVPVEAGQALAASDSTWKLMPASENAANEASARLAAAQAAVAKDTASAPPSAEPSDPDAADVDDSATPTPKALPPRETWQRLAEGGRYDEALDLAERDGFEALCRSASAADLMTLSETARFAKRGSRAQQALVALRERFPGNAQAPMAAFLLGRLASGDRDAARWFRTYLREAPSGAWRREASGRLLEALSRSGDDAAAREAARSYLDQYPHGPHASLAQRILAP